MRQLTFIKDAALKLDTDFVSDHNRSPLSIAYERLENQVRTQRGGMRKYFRADKRTISCSWTNLPETDGDTVDMGMGAQELRDFYENNTGAFGVAVTYDTGVVETFTMVFGDFSLDLISRRGDVNLYNASMSLVEV